MKATKIVATLGPASDTVDTIAAMIEAGCDVFRLNFSHGTPEDHLGRANRVREAAARVGREVAIMGDLQGPKIRVGKFENGKAWLEAGQSFLLDAALDNKAPVSNNKQASLDYKELPQDVKVGDTLLLSDGLIQLKVERVVGDKVFTFVELGGELSNNKGINRLGGGLTAAALTAKDMADIKTAVEIDCDYLAISFPKSANDMQTARTILAAAGGKAKLIAKIERAEAIIPQTLDEIIDASDGIMVARGDLAIEVGNAAVPALQKRMIKRARDRNKLTITATQMMESMISAPVPTRAEVSDVANAVLDGTDAVMTSAETAAGRYPLETIVEMANICAEAEKAEDVKLDADFTGMTFGRIDQSIAMGALFTAYHLGCKAIVALTDSGSTALWMSRHRIHIPIYALTPKLATQRRMALYRNVRPLLMDQSIERDMALGEAELHLKKRGIVASGDIYAITCGEPMGAPGGTNMLKICRVE
ncbi:pyruvate kinase [Polaromonas sp.]|uniref:pyruvate kinase n=1 Tax=Polaromonas sp. TaxID=1869339 RepID=UPI00375377EA